MVVGAVVAVVGAGILLRFVTASDLWLDEALTVNISGLALGDIPDWLRHDGAPPLYYFLLHAWTAVFGDGDTSARALTGVFGVAALPLAWSCGRRIGGRPLAVAVLVVTATSPYAIRYSTEARMYGLEILLVFAGMLALRRAFDDPSPARLAPVAVVSSALLFTQYWCLSLVGVTGLTLLLVAWRGPDDLRRAARRIFVATAIGAATFAAWLPVLFEQRAHTGTPWGTPQLPPGPIGTTFIGFAGGDDHPEGWTLYLLSVPLLVIGALGVAAYGRWEVRLDLRARTPVRAETILGGVTLVVACSVAYVGESAFEPRYSAIVFPMYALIIAGGITLLADARVRAAALALVAVVGLVGGTRNAVEQRTQTGAVAAMIAAEATPGEVVVYCPDQLGPATHRVLARERPDLVELRYPDLSTDVGFVDWVDYEARLADPDRSPERVAARVIERAGTGRIWVVSAGGYRTHDAYCGPLITALAVAGRQAVPRIAPDETIFERAGLYELRVG